MIKKSRIDQVVNGSICGTSMHELGGRVVREGGVLLGRKYRRVNRVSFCSKGGGQVVEEWGEQKSKVGVHLSPYIRVVG